MIGPPWLQSRTKLPLSGKGKHKVSSFSIQQTLSVHHLLNIQDSFRPVNPKKTELKDTRYATPSLSSQLWSPLGQSLLQYYPQPRRGRSPGLFTG